MDLQLRTASEPLPVDTSPLSEVKLVGRKGFLKMHKAIEISGLFSSLFKDGSKVLTSKSARVRSI